MQVMDNYGFIHLDIVWIYVLLADPSFLDHAALHLRLAEEFLRRSHGHGLEKLKQGVEQHVDVGVLYLRLHIAQAVLAHLTGKRGEAVLKIEQAMRELSQLKVKVLQGGGGVDAFRPRHEQWHSRVRNIRQVDGKMHAFETDNPGVDWCRGGLVHWGARAGFGAPGNFGVHEAQWD